MREFTANKHTEEPAKEVVEVTDKTSSDKIASAVTTFPVPTAPGDDDVAKEPSPRPLSQQSALQPKTVKHRKPITAYVNLRWVRDASVRDYVHRKDPVNCDQCRLGIHGDDVATDGIVLRYSQYQKEDTQLDPPSSSTANDQAAALTVPAPRKSSYLFFTPLTPLHTSKDK